MRNKLAKHKPLDLSRKAFRSAVTNGRDLLRDVDGRSALARRFRDVMALHAADLGGEATLSEAQKALIRRVACLTVELERMEAAFVLNDGAKPAELETYQRCANSLRRLLESLGVHRGRVARDVTPDLHDYIASKANGHHGNGRIQRIPRTIDHEADN